MQAQYVETVTIADVLAAIVTSEVEVETVYNPEARELDLYFDGRFRHIRVVADHDGELLGGWYVDGSRPPKNHIVFGDMDEVLVAVKALCRGDSPLPL